ncbi:Putative methyl-CpG-binding domain protein 3-like 5 [Fukomys damarensis]|uniref:Putative methyl-CpG-binding domain protein 3-like 5 n=1 Tax=Fukomys damarensis TaxID=885580 RepID=A0A091CYM0_FUKDA|nr:Putative methyl-CpG-binding domain protein 3-like 5 [Fukomys damarensis]
MISQNLQKKQQVHAPKAKRRATGGCVLPVRLTSCIFPRPVTLITAHPGNEVRYGPHEEKLQKPQQLCASWRLQALKKQGTEEEGSSPLDFTHAFQILTSGSQGGSLDQAAAESSGPSPGLSPFWKEMIPEACHLVPPSYNQQVTAADVQRQARKVKRARERLAKALRADSLAREAESLSGQEERAETQMDTGAGTAGDSQRLLCCIHSSLIHQSVLPLLRLTVYPTRRPVCPEALSQITNRSGNLNVVRRSSKECALCSSQCISSRGLSTGSLSILEAEGWLLLEDASKNSEEDAFVVLRLGLGPYCTSTLWIRGVLSASVRGRMHSPRAPVGIQVLAPPGGPRASGVGGAAEVPVQLSSPHLSAPMKAQGTSELSVQLGGPRRSSQ